MFKPTKKQISPSSHKNFSPTISHRNEEEEEWEWRRNRSSPWNNNPLTLRQTSVPLPRFLWNIFKEEEKKIAENSVVNRRRDDRRKKKSPPRVLQTVLPRPGIRFWSLLLFLFLFFAACRAKTRAADMIYRFHVRNEMRLCQKSYKIFFCFKLLLLLIFLIILQDCKENSFLEINFLILKMEVDGGDVNGNFKEIFEFLSFVVLLS